MPFTTPSFHSIVGSQAEFIQQILLSYTKQLHPVIYLLSGCFINLAMILGGNHDIFRGMFDTHKFHDLNLIPQIAKYICPDHVCQVAGPSFLDDTMTE